jgi:D-alanyl-D-alanine dipeptidase
LIYNLVYKSNSKEKEMKNLNLIDGLIDLEKLDNSFIIDIKYASADNFMGKKVYPVHKCVLQLQTAKKLIAANNRFKALDCKLKVLDAYRPLSVQKLMWEMLPDDNFIAPPTRGSMHNRGTAVDVTLVNSEGQELEMPSPFDDFSEKAWITYNEGNPNLIENREFLAKIMVESGFKRISTEWWHFYDPDYSNYPVQNIGLERFI